MVKLKNLLIAASVLVLLTGALALFPPSPAHTQGTELDGFPVKVVNGDTKPVPTSAQGTTSVAGTVNLANGAKVGVDPANNKVGIDPANSNVNIANTPTVNLAASAKLGIDPANNNVSIANTPTVALSASANTVRVSNTVATPAFIRDADDARQAYQGEATITMADGQATGTKSLTFGATATTVPAGKRLVIEQVSAVGNSFLSSFGAVTFVQTRVDGRLARHFIDLNLQNFSAFGGSRPTASQLERVYADAGSAVDVVVTLDFPIPPGSGNVQALTATVSGYLVDIP